MAGKKYAYSCYDLDPSKCPNFDGGITWKSAVVNLFEILLHWEYFHINRLKQFLNKKKKSLLWSEKSWEQMTVCVVK